jgi:hypothetical protein
MAQTGYASTSNGNSQPFSPQVPQSDARGQRCFKRMKWAAERARKHKKFASPSRLGKKFSPRADSYRLFAYPFNYQKF